MPGIFLIILWTVFVVSVTIFVSNKMHTKKACCNRCKCTQIATFRQLSNNDHSFVNVCQHCGNTWNL